MEPAPTAVACLRMEAKVPEGAASGSRSHLWTGLAGLGLGFAVATVMAFGLQARETPAPFEPPPGETPAVAAEVDDPAVHAAAVLPLERVDGLAVLGDAAACVRGKGQLACTADGGETWVPFGELPERILAVVRQEGEIRVVAADGTIWAMAPGQAPVTRIAPPAGLGVVDAAVRGAEVFLLAHRYDRPADPMRLPRVVATTVLALADGGRLETRGSLTGWAGERLLVQEGEVTIWAPFDTRAHRSRDGGRTFTRVPRNERLGADYGGLLATIERRIEAAKRGREARSLSTLLLSTDRGATWDVALETEGELLVQFAGPADGLAVARAEGTVYRAADGHRFEPALADDRLADAVDAARLGARWLVVTASGLAFRLP